MQQDLPFDSGSISQTSSSYDIFYHSDCLQLTSHLNQHLINLGPKLKFEEKSYVLVHSNLLAEHLKFLFNQNTTLKFPLHFITFFDLAKIILNAQKNYIEKPVLDTRLSKLILHHICQIFFKEDVPNSNLAFLNDKPSFVSELFQSYAYLDKHAVPAWPNAHEDLLILYKKYQSYFLKHHHTQDSFLKTTLDQVLRTPCPLKISHHLMIYGFYDFTPVQKNLLSKLEFTSQSLWLSKQSLAFRKFGQEMHRFTEISPGQAKPKQDEKTYVYSCLNETHELNQLKTSLLDFIAKKTYRLNRIAVLVPNQHYLNLCQSILNDNGIPFYSPIHPILNQSSLGKTLKILLEYALSRKNHADIVKLIHDLPLNKMVFNKSSILRHLHQNHIFTEKLILSNSSPELNSMKQCLTELSRMFNGSNSYQDFFDQFYTFVHAQLDNQFIVEDLEPEIFFQLKSYFKTLKTLRYPFKPTLLFNSLNTFLSSPFTQADNKKMQDNAVFLAPIEYAAFLNFEHTFILGLNQTIFPKPDQTLNLLNIEKHSLDAPPIIKHQKKDTDLFKQLLESCSKLTLSYSQQDQLNDQDLQKSMVFDFLSSTAVVKNKCQMPEDSFLTQDEILSMSDQELFELAQKKPLMPQQLKWSKSHLNPHPKFDAHSGKIILDGHYYRDTYSVTALQRYATCPYQYYLKDVLKIKSRAWPTDTFGLHPMDKGEILHKVLFLFYQDSIQNPNLSIEQKYALLKKIFEHLNQKTKALQKPELWPLEHLNLYQRIKSFIAYEHLSHGDFSPLALEMRFGDFKAGEEDKQYSDDQALCLEQNNEKLYFRGKIDRIDIHTDQKHLHVIDYKSGKATAKNNDFAQGRTIQMAIYLLLCQSRFNTIPLRNMTARMVSIDPKQNFSEKTLSGEYLEENLDTFYQIIFSLNEKINQGVFFQQPGSNMQHCQICDYTSICKSNVDKRSSLVQKNIVSKQSQEL